MSYIDDNQIDVIVAQEIMDLREALEKGKCPDCGSTNIKRSKKGNLYCANLCWIEKEES